MSYSDEPNVISGRRKSKGLWFAAGFVGLLVMALAMVAFYPQYQEFRRKNTPVGPNLGPVYFISIEGERFSMELARSPEMDFHLGVILQPVRDRVAWRPEDHTIRFWVEEQEETRTELEWDPNAGYFGPTEDQFHPSLDYPLEIEIWRGDSLIWNGRRWAYRLRAEHEH